MPVVGALILTFTLNIFGINFEVPGDWNPMTYFVIIGKQLEIGAMHRPLWPNGPEPYSTSTEGLNAGASR